jgi:hypothetical protein
LPTYTRISRGSQARESTRLWKIKVQVGTKQNQPLGPASARERAREGMFNRTVVIVNLIANTTTRAGLRIRAELDRGICPTGIKITDVELASLNLKLDDFHGDWNYSVPHDRK